MKASPIHQLSIDSLGFFAEREEADPVNLQVIFTIR
jgi:hypothetical protein